MREIVRAGNERWLVVKATPEQAWTTVRQFWKELGFVVAVEQPPIGVMETDWAENRAEIPMDSVRRTIGKYIDIFYTTYKRDKFRTRIERGAEPGTVEIYISHRGMEQVPTAKIDNSSPAAFAWAVLPPNPELEAEMLTRLMKRFGTPAPVAPRPRSRRPQRAGRAGRRRQGAPREELRRLVEAHRRRPVRPRLAARGPGARPHGLHRRRPRPLHAASTSCATRDPDATCAKARDQGWLASCMFWKPDEKDRPEQYQIKVVEAAPTVVVSVQDPKGAPDARRQRASSILRAAQGAACS